MFIKPNIDDDTAKKYRDNYLSDNPDYRGRLRQVSIPDTYVRYLTAVIHLSNIQGCPLSDYIGNIIAEHIRTNKDVIEAMIEKAPKTELPQI